MRHRDRRCEAGARRRLAQSGQGGPCGPPCALNQSIGIVVVVDSLVAFALGELARFLADAAFAVRIASDLTDIGPDAAALVDVIAIVIVVGRVGNRRFRQIAIAREIADFRADAARALRILRDVAHFLADALLPASGGDPAPCPLPLPCATAEPAMPSAAAAVSSMNFEVIGTLLSPRPAAPQCGARAPVPARSSGRSTSELGSGSRAPGAANGVLTRESGPHGSQMTGTVTCAVGA